MIFIVYFEVKFNFFNVCKDKLLHLFLQIFNQQWGIQQI